MPPRVRTKEFTNACRQCGQAPPQCKGHEAWECEQHFTINGKRAYSSRQLFQMNLGIVDKHGRYQ